jgi:4-amino-4-deoxy-L-arabinose transferase-like glycosyltransferase
LVDTPEPNGTHRRLAALLVIALALRVGFVAVFHALPAVQLGGERVARPAEQPMFGDAAEYLRMADHLRAGRGPIVDPHGGRLARMPGYAYFLAGIEAVCGRSLLAVRLVQALVGSVAVWLAARLAAELFGGRPALWAAGLVAVYPVFVLYTALILAETLFVTLLLGGLLALLLAMRRDRLALALLAGALLGLAVLVRASLLPAVVLLAGGWAVWRRLRPRALLGAACMLAVVAAALVPWAWRNWRLTGHVVVTTSRAGASLYEALNPEADGGPMLNVQANVPRRPGLDEVERDRQLRREAVEYVREHPGRVAWLALVKFARTWSPVPNHPRFRSAPVCVTVAVPYTIVMVLAAIGLVRVVRRVPGRGAPRAEVLLILGLPVVYYALLHMVFVGSIRYRMPVMPLLMVLAARGVLWLRARVSTSC